MGYPDLSRTSEMVNLLSRILDKGKNIKDLLEDLDLNIKKGRVEG